MDKEQERIDYIMQEEQKQIIITLRSQGESYAEIANYLGMSPNTIKSFCRRSKIRPSPSLNLNAEKTADTCKNCGALLSQNSGKRKKLFCSDRCRYVWWNQERQRKVYRLTCQYCGQTFINLGNRSKRFCSKKCMNLARYEKGYGQGGLYGQP